MGVRFLKVNTRELLSMGIALSQERDITALSKLIVTHGMRIAGCDGGVLYERNQDWLIPGTVILSSLSDVGQDEQQDLFLERLPLLSNNPCGQAVLTKKAIYNNLVDTGFQQQLFICPEYSVETWMILPLVDDREECNGVLLLLNAMDAKGKRTTFDKVQKGILAAYATQAAIRRTNLQASHEVQDLLDSLVGVLSTAIDARTPYNTNHARNMVRYGEHFLNWLEFTGNPWSFSLQNRRQFLLSIWLHDVGKLTVPLEVMDKNSRLGMECRQVFHRFRIIKLLKEAEFYKGDTTEEAYKKVCDNLLWAEKLVEKLNAHSVFQESVLPDLEKLASLTYRDEAGMEQPWLTKAEVEALSIKQGTLTEQERKTMESHVPMTQKMLGEIKFPMGYACVPVWAGMHHEFLDGSGYPMGLAGEQIPYEARLMTILDIFDALTAHDRPYKYPVPLTQAVDILQSMADEGKLDSNILELFCESKPWEAMDNNTTLYRHK